MRQISHKDRVLREATKANTRIQDILKSGGNVMDATKRDRLVVAHGKVIESRGNCPCGSQCKWRD